ncbi:MAG TPA: lamin tail domain-containing protein [Candidatus Bipolaricaulota bacterium]
MQTLVIILGVAILGGFLLIGAFGPGAGGFNNLVIEEIRFEEATRGPDIDEWIVIANRTGTPVDLTGWKIESGDGPGAPPSVGQTYFFPAGCTLPPRGKVYVHSGPTVDGTHPAPQCNQLRIDLYAKWNAQPNSPTGWWQGVAEIGNTVWHNEGDTAWLLRYSGGAGLFVYDRIDTCRYNGNEANGVKKCR